MGRYTLNDRGRFIFIGIPTAITGALLAGTNIIEVFVLWIIT